MTWKFIKSTLPICILVGAFAFSFLPIANPAEAVADLSPLTRAERAIDAAETFAKQAGAHESFVVLSADGEPLLATEMKGTSRGARLAATARANCFFARQHTLKRVNVQDESKFCGTPKDDRRIGAGWLGSQNPGTELIAVAGNAQLDERILSVALESVKP